MSNLETSVAILGLVLLGLAILFFASASLRPLFSRGEENSRVLRARQRRKRAEERADSEMRLTSEVLGTADALVDEVVDMRQRVGAEDLIRQRQRERDRIAGGTPAAGGGGPPPPPLPP